jgi:hypothetical protein
MQEHFVRNFRRNADGSWTCVAHATLSTPKGRIQVTEGSCFFPGTTFMGFDLARWLEERFDGQTHAGA